MDDTTFWSNFAANLKIAIRQASTYVMIAVGLGLQAFTSNPDASAKVASFLGNVGVGFLAPYAGIIVIILVAIAKAWPQVSVTKETLKQAEKAADVKVVDAAKANQAGIPSVAGK